MGWQVGRLRDRDYVQRGQLRFGDGDERRGGVVQVAVDRLAVAVPVGEALHEVVSAELADPVTGLAELCFRHREHDAEVVRVVKALFKFSVSSSSASSNYNENILVLVDRKPTVQSPFARRVASRFQTPGSTPYLHQPIGKTT